MKIPNSEHAENKYLLNFVPQIFDIHGGRQVMSNVSVATSVVFLLESNQSRSIACPSRYG